VTKAWVVVVAIVFAACTPAPAPSPEPSAAELPTELASPSAASGCLLPSDPAAHVYHPARLQVIAPCITVTGTIDFKRPEADGDYHVGLKLDTAYAGLVNDCNSTCLNGAEHGDLVVEPVCELPVTQPDAVTACMGYHDPLVVPAVGAHVTVTGTYVLDTAHGWTELHPVASITETPSA